MANKFFLSIILLMIISLGFSQSRIKVHFPGAEKKTAHVWGYSDFISFTKTELNVIQIDKKGNFEFKIYLNNPKPIFIQVDFTRIQLYIEPKRDYIIEINAVDFRDAELYPKNVIGYLSPEFKIIEPTEHELNRGLEKSKELFSSFVDSNYLSLIRGQNVKFLVDSFANVVDTFLANYNNQYLKNYVEPEMAQLRLLSHDYSQKMVVDKYFAGKNLNLDDPNAMGFFNSFFSNYLLTKGKGYTFLQLDSVINIQRSYQALFALLDNDPLLSDPVLRELVIIRNVQQLYSNRKFDQSAILDILSDISRSKLRTEHRKIATNVRKRLITYEKGSKVPDFEFVDIEGQSFKLSDFEGMYVYINVWDTECESCLAEMEFTKTLFEDFDDVIKFISISVDANDEVMKSYIKSREFQWTFAPLGENYQFLNDFEIGTLPRYILIDKEGKIENINAPSPSNRFSDYFLKMLNDKKGNLIPKN